MPIRRKKKPFVNRLWLGLIVSAGLTVSLFAADEYTKVPAKVNVLKGVTVSTDDIKAVVNEANEILKKAKIQLEFNSAKDIKTDASDTGNDDGNIQSSEETALDEAGRKELDNSFGGGKGIKIYITNKIRDKDSTRGLAPHAKEKDGKLSAKPVIYLKKTTATNKSKGNDLAHETCHVLTLGKNHVIDKANNKNADNTWHHPDDPNNLMYPYNPYTRDGKPVDRGSNLTDDQIKEIQEGAKRLGKTKVVKTTDKQIGFLVDPLPTLHGGFVDEMGETPTPFLDLGAVQFFAETPSAPLEINLLLEGQFPGSPLPAEVRYSIYFNSDNNDLTGENYGIPGVDKIVDIYVWGQQPRGPLDSGIYDIQSGRFDRLPCGSVERISKILDSSDDLLPPEVTDYVDGVRQTVPIELLELSLESVVPVFVDAVDFSSSEFDEFGFPWTPSDPGEPNFRLSNTRLNPCDPLVFSGSNFTPGADVEILFNDDLQAILPGTPAGDIGGSVPLPPGADFGTHFVTARDTVSGRFDFSVCQVVPNIADLNRDRVVNLPDVQIIGDNWLANPCP